MSKLKVGELFAGIGGFTKGLEETGGFETVFFVENNPFCQKVLAKNFPHVEIYNDVTNFKYSANVDMVTAGFPCQDISHAGKGAGLSGERSGLFWYIIRTLCMVGRPMLLLENVAALLNRGLCTVLGALASFGYDAEWHCIPASYVGAPHQRDRIWIFATDNRKERTEGIIQEKVFREQAFSWCKDVRGIEDLRNRPDIPNPIFRGGCDGLPYWMDRVGSCGNAVVPQIPEIIGKAILEAHHE